MRKAYDILCRLALFALLSTGAGCVSINADYGDDERAAFLKAQVQNDMFYGADDYFGDYRDLAYADRVQLVSTPTRQPAASQTSGTRTPRSSGGSPTSAGGNGSTLSETTGGDTDDSTIGSDDDSPTDGILPDDSDTIDDGPDGDVDDDIADDISDDIGDDNIGGG